MELQDKKSREFPQSSKFALKLRYSLFSFIRDGLLYGFAKGMIFVCDKNHFEALPEGFEYYSFCPDYVGNEFTNYMVLPSHIVKLMDVYPEIKDVFAYQAYEISAYFPKEYSIPKRPNDSLWLYDFSWRIYEEGLPQKVRDEINMLERRIPQWLTNSKKADQRCSLILNEYLLLEKMNAGKVFRDELAKVVGEEMIRIHGKDTFDICFNDMCGIHEKGYGKTFQVEIEDGKERVYLWCFAEIIIRRIEEPELYGPKENDCVDKLLSYL